MDNDIEKASQIVRNGGIIIFPTDTAFGIGCRMDRNDSVEKLFRIRKRPTSQATPVLVSSVEMARDLVEKMPAEVETLMEKNWPGPLTIILPAKKDKVLSLVRGGSDNVGVRMPNNDIILEIINRVGVPVLGPSANFHGEETPYETKDLDKDLVKLVDYVLKGKSLFKKPSTVLDCSKKPWNIIRKGALDINI
jgi:L-threonylcarbamoyladenylate synthase